MHAFRSLYDKTVIEDFLRFSNNDALIYSELGPVLSSVCCTLMVYAIYIFHFTIVSVVTGGHFPYTDGNLYSHLR